MKTTLSLSFLLILILCFNFPSLSFEKNDSTETNGSILKTKPIAFQLAIGSLLHVTNFDNLHISVKKQFTNSFGLRLGLGINLSQEDLGGNDLTFSQNDLSVNDYANYVTTVVDMIYYVRPNDIVKAFIGLGPYFSYSESSTKRTRNNSNYQNNYYDYNRSISLGANALLGIEWFATSNFSFFAEYNFAYTYSWQKYIHQYTDSGYSESYDLDGNETQFKGKELKFGITVYL
ncbi:MAG: outer membrane beta-barrel protein [Ignavibacteriae bacterium]|nr:outer membrane beta-barrel protein [Ignavibacteriota bacterium]